VVFVGSCWKIINNTYHAVDCLVISENNTQTIIENIPAQSSTLLPLHCTVFKDIKFRPHNVDSIGYDWSFMPKKSHIIYCCHLKIPDNYWVFAFENVNEKAVTIQSTSTPLGEQKPTQVTLKSAIPCKINELLLYCPLRLENLLACEMEYRVRVQFEK
jgi:hypothetical protein